MRAHRSSTVGMDAAYVYLPDPAAPAMIVLDFDVHGCLFGVNVLDASKLLPRLDPACRL